MAQTTVTDVFYQPTGAPLAGGTISIYVPSAFYSTGGHFVPVLTPPSNGLQVRIKKDGTFSVALFPTDIATGAFYTVCYSFGGPCETWTVPTSIFPVNLSVVRTVPAPIPGGIVALSAIAGATASPGTCITSNGTSWVSGRCVQQCISGSSGTNHVCSLSPTLTAYTQDAIFEWRSQSACVGGDTLSIDGLGALPIQKESGGTLIALAANDCLANTPYLVQFVTSSFKLYQSGGPGAWQTITLQNGWTIGGADQYRLEQNGNTVRVTGTIAAGTTTDGTVIFTFPVGFRPPMAIAFPVVVLGGGGTPTGTCEIQVSTLGAVTIYGFGANTFIRLDSISFSIN
jgi:hypothetical protein